MPQKKKFTPAQLKRAKEAAYEQFGHRPNFTGVDIGYQWRANERSDQICVRIHVERKIPAAELAKGQAFPDEIEGVPLDVITGPYHASRGTRPSEHRRRSRYLMGGLSCGRSDGGTGTLGALVIDQENDAPAILSNWHVLAGARARAGDPVLQPGGVDSGVPVRDEVAQLSRWLLDRDGDAALATLTDARDWLPVQFGAFPTLMGMRNSRLGETLHKSGRTTAQTKGVVDGEGLYRLTYEVRPSVFEAKDIEGFKIVAAKPGNPDDEELSAGGDSGSVWYNDTTRDAVGLHFAGETSPAPMAEHAIACNIVKVADRLNFRLATFDDLLRSPAVAPQDVVGSDLTRGLSIDPTWPDCGPWGPWGPIIGHWTPPGGWPRPCFPPYDMRGFPRHAGSVGPLEDPRFATDFHASAMRRFRRDATGGLRSEDANSGLSLLDDIWPRLYDALVTYDSRFAGIDILDEVRSVITPGAAHSTIAAAINDVSAFAVFGLPAVNGGMFMRDTTFLNICGTVNNEIGRSA